MNQIATPKAVRRRGFQSFYSRGEEIFNAVSHIVGASLGLIAWVIGLIVVYPSAGGIVSMSVFGVCVVTLYTMSALYHFLPDGKAKGVFRIFDHCTIFLLIAGTYTPFCAIGLKLTPVAIGILIGEWVLAVLGITANAIAMKSKFVKVVSMIFYVVMGWAALFFFPVVYSALSPLALGLLLGGGLAYTIGIVFYALGKKVPYFHSVWHLWDIAGTLLQFSSLLVILL